MLAAGQDYAAGQLGDGRRRGGAGVRSCQFQRHCSEGCVGKVIQTMCLAAMPQVTTQQSCYLPFTRDSQPCMGKAPQHENVYVATGRDPKRAGVWSV